MDQYTIITDGSCDLSLKDVEELGVRVVPFYIAFEEENYLKGLSKEEMSKKLAYYMAELNVLHPFREGNGRAIREFIRELAAWNGYELDLTKTTPKNMLDACIESVVDTNNLEEILYKCLV